MPVQKSKVTIFDGAKASGVSSSAVSYALNGKSGVSDETRSKVLKIAHELGWKPNGAAQALAKAKTQRIGLVLDYDPELLSVESFMMELISGLGAELEKHDYSILIRMAVGEDAKMAIIEDWVATGNVDGLLLVNIELGDPCVKLLEEADMPVLAVADASVVSSLPSLSSADADAVRQAVQYLYDLGHRHIARVGGPESLAHSYIRDSAFADVASDLGIRYRCLHTDYTPETGREATERLLGFSEHPTAIIYDNDVMALAGLGVAASMGIKVPDELSIISWDDSFMCNAAYPNLTAMGRDVVGTGKKAAELLLRLINGKKVGHIKEAPYELRARESTGPVARNSGADGSADPSAPSAERELSVE